MTAMRALAVLALLMACVSAQTVQNPTFSGCSVGPPPTFPAMPEYADNLASVPSSIYFTNTVPASIGTCLSDFTDDAGNDVDIEQAITGVTVGTTYTISITVGNGQPSSGPITFTLFAGDTAVPTTQIASTSASAPSGADPATVTLSGSFLATATTLVVRVAFNNGGAGGVPIADNLSVVDASVVGDPHFIGFQGQVFDFIGEPDTAYNLLSDYDIQFNTFLFLRRQTHHSFIPGPVMKELVCLVDGHVVFISCGGYERPEVGYVTVDGQRLVDGQKLSLGRLSVGYKTVSAWSKDYGMAGKDYLVGSVNIHIDGAYAFHVVLVENGRNINNPNIWVTALPQRYLDFSAHIIDHSRQPHGVFGQTSRLDVALEDWTIEGEEADYILNDGVFGSDFKFNKFLH